MKPSLEQAKAARGLLGWSQAQSSATLASPRRLSGI
jgi:hypothetical protein